MRVFLLAAIAATLLGPLCHAQTLWRLTAYTFQAHDGASFKPAADSIAYHYNAYNTFLLQWDPANGYFYNIAPKTHDSAIHYQCVPNFFPWWKYNAEIQTFDAQQNITSRTKIIKTPNQSFVNDYRELYTYDGANNLTTHIFQFWTNNQWTNVSSETYTYLNGNLATKLEEMWNGTAGMWENSVRRTYSYTNGKLSEEVMEDWSGSYWSNYDKFLYTYDANNRLAQRLAQHWGSQSWYNVRRSGYSYDAQGNFISDTSQKWHPLNGLQNDYLFVYKYDANNKVTSYESNSGTTAPGSWEKSQKIIYTYNTDTLLDHTEILSWNGTTNTWDYTTNSMRTNFYYQQFTVGIPEVAQTESNLTLYPNPAITQLRTNATWKNAQPFTVSILDMSGRLLKQWSEAATKTYSSATPVMDMPAGNYTIVLNNGEQKSSRRFLVLK